MANGVGRSEAIGIDVILVEDTTTIEDTGKLASFLRGFYPRLINININSKVVPAPT